MNNYQVIKWIKRQFKNVFKDSVIYLKNVDEAKCVIKGFKGYIK